MIYQVSDFLMLSQAISAWKMLEKFTRGWQKPYVLKSVSTNSLYICVILKFWTYTNLSRRLQQGFTSRHRSRVSVCVEVTPHKIHKRLGSLVVDEVFSAYNPFSTDETLHKYLYWKYSDELQYSVALVQTILVKSHPATHTGDTHPYSQLIPFVRKKFYPDNFFPRIANLWNWLWEDGVTIITNLISSSVRLTVYFFLVSS